MSPGATGKALLPHRVPFAEPLGRVGKGILLSVVLELVLAGASCGSSSHRDEEFFASTAPPGVKKPVGDRLFRCGCGARYFDAFTM